VFLVELANLPLIHAQPLHLPGWRRLARCHKSAAGQQLKSWNGIVIAYCEHSMRLQGEGLKITRIGLPAHQ
jgi:hypothetical protein